MESANPSHAAQLHEVALVAMVAVILGLGLLRLRQPPVVGYILAGIALGPTGFGLISQSGSIGLLAELGVLVLLFLIGMELSIRAFIAVIKPAVLIAAGQLGLALGITTTFSLVLGWSLAQTLLLAFVVAVSSTAVAIKMLEEIGELRSETGRITIGVLIAQDIAIVPMLIVTDALGGEDISAFAVTMKIAAAVAFLIWLVWRLGRPGKIHLPGLDLLEGKPDVLALAAMAICFTAATLSGFLGLSPAYGAFVAGLVLASSTLRSELISVTHPIQSILLFVFFLSVGLLLDISYIMDNFATVFLFVLGVIGLKTALNIALTRFMGYSLAVAIPAGLSMAQIGEFSFVLAAAGLSNGAIDFGAYRLAIAVIAVSLLVSPLWIISVRRFHEVADQGITTFRAAFRETYPGEMAEMERGAVFVGRTTKRTWLAALAAIRKLRNARGRKNSAKGITITKVEKTPLPKPDEEDPQPSEKGSSTAGQ